ncbi:MAG: hypothetical protein H8J66_11815 [Nitrospira sp.]|nr:hypothetical protein [Nitrospira sp.]
MFRLNTSPYFAALLAIGFCVTAACNDVKFRMPQLGDPPPPQPVIPAAVTVSFDPSVRNAILEHQACADVAWKGPLGEAIIQAFQETGRARFAQMAVVDTVGVPKPVSVPVGATPVSATIKLVHQALTARTRTGSDDRYLAQLDIQLIATFYDLQGQPVPDAPLIYSDSVKVWTPQFAGSGQCATQELTEVMNTAVEHLTTQFYGYVGQFVTKLLKQAPPVAQIAASPVSPAAETVVAAPARTAAAPITAISTAQPAPAATGQDQNRYAIMVNVGLYRSPWSGWREGLSVDNKETVPTLARSFNVPDNQTLLLQDELASQADIEEALSSWLPKRIGKDSIVFVYFSGQALADAKTGEVYLIPYDGTPASSRTRLISLRWIQSRLQKLGAKLALAVIDTPIASNADPKDSKTKSVGPNWTADLAGSAGPSTPTVIQIARTPNSTNQPQGLLSGLNGNADLDHDGVITVGEWLRSLRGTATTVPTLPPTVAVQSIPLVRVSR